MAKQYVVNGNIRFVNGLVKFLNRLGLAGGATYTLTTTGRKTGEARSTPVTIAVREGNRYLVAPYGDVGWVLNVRANSTARLAQKSGKETITLTEVAPDEAGPVLKQYYDKLTIVRPYFDVSEGASVEEFTAKSNLHPVFRITP